MEDTGIYEDPGVNGGQPNTDGVMPEGGGTHSGSSAGGDKIDPISAGPSVGNTIAGRSRDLSSSTSVGNAGGDARDPSGPSASRDADGGGTTGTTGHESADDHPSSLSRAAERVNPGDSQTGSAGSESEN